MTDTTTPTSTAPLFRLVTADSTNEAIKAFPEIISNWGNYIQQIINLDDDDEYEILMSKNNSRLVYYDYDEVSGNWIEKNTGFESVSVGWYPTPNIVDINGVTHLVVGGGLHKYTPESGAYIDTYTKNSEGNWTKLSDEDNPFNHIFYPSNSSVVSRFFDMNGDGDLELVAGQRGVIDIYDQDSSGEWVKQDYGYSTNITSIVQEMAPGDYDNDGDADIITGVYYLQNDGNIWTDLGDFHTSPLSGNSGSYLPYSFDIDGDGDLDLLLPVVSGDPHQIYENLLYSPDDAVKVIRHDSKQIDMNHRQKNNINLDDYFTDKTGGDLTFQINEKHAFATRDDNIVTFASDDESHLGSYSLQVTATNSAGFTRKQAINIDVTNIGNIGNNAPPVPTTRIETPRQDTQDTWTLDLNTLFDDPEGDNLTFTVENLPTFTTYEVEDAEIIFTTDNTDPGTYTVTVKAEDPLGGPVANEYIFEVKEQNDAPAPIPVEGIITIKEDEKARREYDIEMYDHFDDEEDDDMIFAIEFSIDGTVVNIDAIDGFAYDYDADDAEYTFRATKDVDQTITATITATEDRDDTLPAESAVLALTFTVSGRNDTPTTKFAVPNLAHEQVTATVTEDAPFSYNVITPLGFNDEESGTALTYSISGDESEHFSINAKTGEITAEHTEHTLLGTDGAAIITVKASDGNSSVSASLSLNMLYVNDAPDFIDGSFVNIQEDAEKLGQTITSVNLESFFTDEEGDNFTVKPVTASLPDGLEVVLNPEDANEHQFKATKDFGGATQVTLIATDIHGDATTSILNINVTAHNDKPTEVISGVVKNFTITEDSTAEGDYIDLQSHFQDEEGNELVLSVNETEFPSGFTFDKVTTGEHAGKYLLRATKAFDNDAPFEVVVTAEEVGNEDTHYVKTSLFVNVTAVNDRPVLKEDAILEHRDLTEEQNLILNLNDIFENEEGAIKVSGDDKNFNFDIMSMVGSSDESFIITLVDDERIAFRENSEFTGTSEVRISITESDTPEAYSTEAVLTFQASNFVNDKPIAEYPTLPGKVNEVSELTSAEPAFSFNIADFGFDDEESDFSALTFAAPNLPDWLSFDEDARTITGNPDHEVAGATHLITITASDTGRNGDDEKTVTATLSLEVDKVNDKPTVAESWRRKEIFQKQSAEYNVLALFGFNDEEDGVDENGNTDMSFSITGNTDILNFESPGSHILKGDELKNDEVGQHTFTITATDNGEINNAGEQLAAKSVSAEFVLLVRNYNDAPMLVEDHPEHKFMKTPGAEINIDLNDYFTDPDLKFNIDSLQYAVTIPTALRGDFRQSSDNIIGTISAEDIGKHIISVQAYDSYGTPGASLDFEFDIKAELPPAKTPLIININSSGSEDKPFSTTTFNFKGDSEVRTEVIGRSSYTVKTIIFDAEDQILTFDDSVAGTAGIDSRKDFLKAIDNWANVQNPDRNSQDDDSWGIRLFMENTALDIYMEEGDVFPIFSIPNPRLQFDETAWGTVEAALGGTEAFDFM